MPVYLGIDVGGTKTHALLADENGNALGFGCAGAGNHESVGYDGLIRAMEEALQGALEQSGKRKEDICGAGFGIAGYDFPSERRPTLESIAALGLSCPVEAVNDVVIGLIAGTREGWGVVVDAGTGNNVRARTRDGREGWVTGCGGLFGEYGGAVDIVYRAVQAVSHHWSTRGPTTKLSEAFMNAFSAPDLTTLIEGIALGTYALSAELARLVFEVAYQGDEVAREVIRWVAQELGETTKAVIRQVNLQDQAFEVVLIGSVFKGGALFTEPLLQTIRTFAPLATFHPLQTPPVAGAVLLGMEQSGIIASQKVRTRLMQSTSTLMKVSMEPEIFSGN